MVSKLNEDLFIEPAGDSDIIYGDYNTSLVFIFLFQKNFFF